MDKRTETAVQWHAWQCERCARNAAASSGPLRAEYASRATDHALAAQALCEGAADVRRLDRMLLLALAAAVIGVALALAALA